MYQVRTDHFPSPFSARYEYVAPPEPETVPLTGKGDEEPEECMEEKQEILQEREDRKNKKRKPPLPGQRLLRKLAKAQQLEESLARVVKSLH
jgi:hypothetical protein